MNTVYIVNELVVLTDNQFEVYNNCHGAYSSIESATEKANELIEIASRDFNDADIEVNESCTHFEVTRSDNYDRIEVNIDKVEM